MFGLPIQTILQMLLLAVLIGLLVLPAIGLAAILILRQRRRPAEVPELTKEEAKSLHKEADSAPSSKPSEPIKSEAPMPDCVLVPAPLVNNSSSFPYRHSLDAC